MNNFENIRQCHDEPIRTPHAIQPFSYLIIFNADNIIQFVSSNLILAFEELFGYAIGENISLYFAVDNFILKDGENKKFLKLSTVNKKNRFNCFLYRVGNLLGLEFEIYNPLQNACFQKYENKHKQLTKSTTLDSFLKSLVQYIFQIIHFDRVMLYKFDNNFNGVVINEAKRDYAKSYLNHHFPADDIPAQARALYIQNIIRIIPDATYEPIKILPNSETAIDLTYVSSRSVSPIHCEYLANMNIKASMSLSLVVDNKLWGLIACHSYEPHYISLEIRNQLELQLYKLNLILENLIKDEQNRLKEVINAKAVVITNLIQTRKKPSLNKEIMNKISRLVNCDGIFYLSINNKISLGSIPNEGEINKLIDFCGNRYFFASSTMLEYIPDLTTKAAGFILVNIDEHTKIMCFRKEYIETIIWAGSPEKIINKDGHIVYFSPRHSFEAYKQIEKGKSKPWVPIELNTLKQICKLL